MRITKLGHSCVLVETKGVAILIDPGKFSFQETVFSSLEAIFITHEHPDHCDIEWVRKLLQKFPEAHIFASQGAVAVLSEAGVTAQEVSHGYRVDVGEVSVVALGSDHAEIISGTPACTNTGFLVDGEFFHPGDAFTVPEQNIEVLAVPLSAPWSRVADVLSYLKTVKPGRCIVVHDGLLSQNGLNVYGAWLQKAADEIGCEVFNLHTGHSLEIN